MKIRFIEPIGTDTWVQPVADQLREVANPGTEIEVVSLRNPHCHYHVEYHAYEGLVAGDIIKVTRDAGLKGFDAVVVSCFYDPYLREAREVSGDAIVVGPCQASFETVASLANKVSVIVGRRKWINHMEERVRGYGYGHMLASFKPVELGVEDFQKDHAETERRMIAAAEEAIEKDGAEAIILGCTQEFGFYSKLQKHLGVPVIDCAFAAFKRAEQLADLKLRFGWTPSRKWSCEAPPEETEIKAWGVFDDDDPPIGGSVTVRV